MSGSSSRVVAHLFILVMVVVPVHASPILTSFTIDSAVMGDTYRILLALPGDYDHLDPQGYPLVVLLDADWHFDPALSLAPRNAGMMDVVDRLVAEGAMPPVILAGVGYVTAAEIGENRGRDFHARHGDFLIFLRDELLPVLEGAYNTDPDKRILVGHSSAGWFTTFEFLRHPYGVFDRYVALSTNYEHDAPDPLLYAMEQMLADRLAGDMTCAAGLYVGVGELEEERFTGPHATFTGRLEGRGYLGFRFAHEVRPGEDHGSVVLPGFEAGLRWVFAEDAVARAERPLRAAPVIGAIHPNPFNPRTTITYAVPREGRVHLQVFDARGGLVRVLADQRRAAGTYTAIWDGRDRKGDRMPGGVYLIRLVTPVGVVNGKLTLLQ